MSEGVAGAVARIVADVRTRGDAALLDLAERFDGARPAAIAVPREEIEAAPARVDPGFLTALRGAIARIRDDAKIAVSPGPGFGAGGDGFQRINFATQAARVEEAVERLQRAFADLQ